MENWLRISLLLCTFGFLREMRPSEPFVTEFLSGEWRNITAEQVNHYIYPLGTYSYMAQLVIIFLITDILRYKPIIVLSACTGIILWSLLLWTYNLLGLQVVQIFYGTYMSAEVAYFTYIYSKVDAEKYQQVTGHTRSAFLVGKFIASVLAQILISYNLLDFRELNYISLATQILSLVFALMLPSVKTSLYFYSTKSPKHISNDADMDSAADNKPGNEINSTTLSISNDDKKNSADANEEIVAKFSWKKAMQLIWQHIYAAYSNTTVIQWSIWWSLAMCGYLQVASYIQLLWKEIEPDDEKLYNGAVEATVTLLSSIATFTAGFLNSSKYQQWDLWILTLCSVFEGGFLLWASLTDVIWIAYVMYVLFGVVYFFMITIASATVAKHLIEDSFGLIFGINTLVALILQSIFTVVIISRTGFFLDPRGQFLSFGIYFMVLASLYATTGVFVKIKNKYVKK